MHHIRNIIPSQQVLPITKIVDTIMEGKQSDLDYLYFDPKSSKKTDGKSLPKNKITYQSAIVFVVGGGNYNEYLNLQEYAKVFFSFPFFNQIFILFLFFLRLKKEELLHMEQQKFYHQNNLLHNYKI